MIGKIEGKNLLERSSFIYDNYLIDESDYKACINEISYSIIRNGLEHARYILFNYGIHVNYHLRMIDDLINLSFQSHTLMFESNDRQNFSS